METHLIHGNFKKRSLHSIVSLTHIEFKGHESMFALDSRLHGVKYFIDNNDIIGYKPSRHRGTLGMGDDVKEDEL